MEAAEKSVANRTLRSTTWPAGIGVFNWALRYRASDLLSLSASEYGSYLQRQIYATHASRPGAGMTRSKVGNQRKVVGS
jgi:hypothetical protein